MYILMYISNLKQEKCSLKPKILIGSHFPG